MKKWELPGYFVENFQKIDIEFYKVVHSESEKILNDKIQVSDSITKRAFTILGISASTLALSIGFLSESKTFWFTTVAIAEGVFCLFSMICLVNPIVSRIAPPLGNSPNRLLNSKWIEGFPTDELRIKNLLLNLSLINEDRISVTEDQNRLRAYKVDLALLILGFSPIVSVLTACIADLIKFLVCHAPN